MAELKLRSPGEYDDAVRALSLPGDCATISIVGRVGEPMNRSHKRAEVAVRERPITFRAAKDLGAFDLAQLWADRTAWPLDERAAYDELAELACMSVEVVPSTGSLDLFWRRPLQGREHLLLPSLLLGVGRDYTASAQVERLPNQSHVTTPSRNTVYAPKRAVSSLMTVSSRRPLRVRRPLRKAKHVGALGVLRAAAALARR